MSLAQILGHLRTGDVIIVRDGDASLRRGCAGPCWAGRTPWTATHSNSRKLLRNLIAVRKGGGKKK